MTGKEKIEKLTDGWYGFTLFAGVIGLLQSGFGLFSLLFGAASVLFSLFITFVVGRWLLSRSSIARFIVMCLSALGLVAGSLGAFKMGSELLSDWSFGLILQLTVMVALVLMHLRSLRTLTDSSVKAYFRS